MNQYKVRQRALRQRPYRTLGSEPELTSIRDQTHPPTKLDSILALGRGTIDSAADELAESHFQQLFELSGRDATGRWIPNLIPDRITLDSDFSEVRDELGQDRFETRGGQTFLVGWGSFSGDQLFEVLGVLLQARGKHESDLQIRKNHSAWPETSSAVDKWIPERVAEEWRGDRFSSLEFPMMDGSRREGDLVAYQVGLYQRLGIVDPGDSDAVRVTETLPAHVHWLPHLDGVGPEERLQIHEALIGFWGAANERLLIESLTPMAELRPDRSLPLKRAGAAKLADGFDFGQSSILPLTLETYRRLSAAPEGIRVTNRLVGLDPTVDVNFPPVFKRLSVGMRGKLGAAAEGQDTPVPTIHLEARSGQSVQANLDALPVADPVTGEIDLDSLLAHRGSGPFGLVSELEALQASALEAGLDPRLVADLARSPAPDGWPAESYLAALLLPLTPWEDRSLVAEREQSKTQVVEARRRWSTRIQDLWAARQDPTRPYQPDWLEPMLEFPDGVNRVYSRSVSHLDFFERGPGYFHNSDPDYVFNLVLRSEAVRSMIESGLGDIVRVKPPSTEP